MNRSYSLEDFARDHPYAADEGVKSLYRMRSINWENESHIDDLLLRAKLFHSKPSQLNDPFECRPHFQWPRVANDVRRIRQHLLKIARKHGGLSAREAQRLVRERMADPMLTTQLLAETGIASFGELRLCSFASSVSNLLMWSHYGDSHRGYCLEFSTNTLPIALAQKVYYTKDYPVAPFPPEDDARNLRPALIKSPEWSYEGEYRTLFTPGMDFKIPNDGLSLFLPSNSLTGIYFGVNTSAEDKERIIEKVARGPFNPTIYDGAIAKSTFEIIFTARA